MGTRAMKRVEQVILIVSFGGFCWLAMQVVHELGHVVGAWMTGGEVVEVVLHPLEFSRTDMRANPRPGVVVWMGPIVGVVLPLLGSWVAKVCRWPGVYMWRVFAGFCLIANGTYIAFGSGERWTDTAVMLAHGTPRWVMVVFGLAAGVAGLYLWNGQGKHFGLGEAKGKADRGAVIVSVGLLTLVVLLELLMAGCFIA